MREEIIRAMEAARWAQTDLRLALAQRHTANISMRTARDLEWALSKINTALDTLTAIEARLRDSEYRQREQEQKPNSTGTA